MRTISLALLLGGALACGTAVSTPPAELVIHNAVIYTASDAQARAEAIAIRGGRFVVVGSNADALELVGSGTRVVDAGGKTVLPGLQDAHGHFTGLGASLQVLKLRGTKTYDEIVEMVRARAATARPGEWIQGRSWDQNDWPDAAWPTHDKLTAAAPNNPVYLTRVDGHAALVNHAAMTVAGLSRDTKDPAGGRIMRDAKGHPTGVLIDLAQGLVSQKIPEVSAAQLEDQIRLADAEARRLGVTMVHDAGVDPKVVDAYKRLVDNGELKTRLYVMLSGSLNTLQVEFDKGPLKDYAKRHLMVQAIKIQADGALGSRGAALLEPYADEPKNIGLLTTPPEEVHAKALAASKAGFQTCIHAIGDRANRQVLDLYEQVYSEAPVARNLRLRIEHAQILDAADIPRFAELNVIASMQTTHATSDMPWVPARLGPARTAEGAYVWQKLIKSGAILANGSDFPVEEPNPMLGFYAGVTRQDPAGNPAGGWMPDQRLSRTEVLKAFTWNAAFAAHADTELGSIEPGKYGDLVMLDRDVMSIDAKSILDARVLLTVIGGEVVFEPRLQTN
ncbi:MAG: amidohydrolase [Vicinamibacterales bacterium]